MRKDVEDRNILLERKLRVENRIVCDEEGYPACEARYLSTQEWEDDHQMTWDVYVSQQLG